MTDNISGHVHVKCDKVSIFCFLLELLWKLAILDTSIVREGDVNLQQSIVSDASRPIYSKGSYGRSRAVQYKDPDEYLKALNSIYSLEISMIEMYSSDAALRSCKSFNQLRSSHQFCAKYLRDLIIENHGIPEERSNLSLFELGNIAVKICNHLPSPICEKTFTQTSLQSEKSLKLKYRSLLKQAPFKDKQLILQLQICCSSHIRSILSEIHPNGWIAKKPQPLNLIDQNRRYSYFTKNQT
jgi:hypothetical protein